MKSHHLFMLATAAWTAAVVLTFVATFKPQLAIVAAMWAVISLTVAGVSSIAILLSRCQYETVEDVRALLRSDSNGHRPVSRI